MAIDAGRLKHLELIQQVITRMASNSFLLKGWSVTLISAILAVAFKDRLTQALWIAFLPVIMFWILDGYFLRQERLYRALWNRARNEDQATPTDFGMDTSRFTNEVRSWPRICFSRTLRVFHGTLFIVLVLLIVGSYCAIK